MPGRGSPRRMEAIPFGGRGIHPPALYQVLRAFPTMPILIELKAVEAQDEVAEVLLEERAVERCVSGVVPGQGTQGLSGAAVPGGG